jgi:hypothetical protein
MNNKRQCLDDKKQGFPVIVAELDGVVVGFGM